MPSTLPLFRQVEGSSKSASNWFHPSLSKMGSEEDVPSQVYSIYPAKAAMPGGKRGLMCLHAMSTPSGGEKGPGREGGVPESGLLGSVDSQLDLLKFMSVDRKWASRDVVVEEKAASAAILLSLTATHHTIHQCMSFTPSNNIITIRVRRSGSHFLVDIQSKNGLNVDRQNADISEINPCRHSVRCLHSVRLPFKLSHLCRE